MSEIKIDKLKDTLGHLGFKEYDTPIDYNFYDFEMSKTYDHENITEISIEFIDGCFSVGLIQCANNIPAQIDLPIKTIAGISILNYLLENEDDFVFQYNCLVDNMFGDK